MVKDYNIWRVKVPLGRKIGDNNCYYDHFHVCLVQLIDEDGTVAYGYGEKVAQGVFKKPVSWQGFMPDENQIKFGFKKDYWDLISKLGTEVLSTAILDGDHYLNNALRFALWDLKAKKANIPLFKVLSPDCKENSLPAYASGLDFHNDIDWLIEFYQQKIDQGFDKIKLKVGHENPEIDLERLLALRSHFGNSVEIAIDANIAWDAPSTIKIIESIQVAGVNLSYVEDPIPPKDVEGYKLLAKELPVKIAGHDYISDPDHLIPLLDTGALSYLRIRDGIGYGIKAGQLASKYGLSLILCNTFLEWGLHIGVGNSRVDRIEFADLGWNRLVNKPFRIENGRMYVHNVAGHGLDPNLELIEKWKI